MAITKNTSNIKDSEQVILNMSRDDAFDVLAVEFLEFDGVNLVRKETKTQNTYIIPDTGSGYTYVCKSPVGTALATAKWQVARIDANGSKMYADGNAIYDNVASNPAALTFSYS